MRSISKPLLVIWLSSLLSSLFIAFIPARAQEKTPMAKPSQAMFRTGEKKEAIIARLEQRIPQLMKEGDVPGLSVAMLREGKLVWHRGFGVKNSKTSEQVTDSTIFEAASLSKPVFAYAVLKLVEAGKMDLDTPLNKYMSGNYDVGDDVRLGQITARRVLSHTTGFPNWRPRGRELKIYFTPGEKFSYSGEGFVYLSKVVERITGDAFNDLMKKLVFDPLGMNSSSYVWQEIYESQKADSHNVKGEPTGRSKPAQANAAASLHTTAEDYAKFVAAILNANGLKKDTIKKMLTPQIKVDEGGTNTTNRPADRLSPYISWGLGWGLQQTSDGLSFWHWGDNGNFKAYIVAYEKQKCAVIVFANSANGLSIVPEIVSSTFGGHQPALSWINYETYNSPGRLLFKNILAKGATEPLREYRLWRAGRASGEIINESRMNQLGYDLLAVNKVKDAIEVFKLNVEDYPQSYNTWDSLAEAYMTAGEKELAIKNYERSIELNPDNTNGIEMLKKLRGNQ